MKKPSRSFSFYFLCSLLLFLSLNGLVGGVLLFAKTDGSLLGMQPGWLSHSPFATYLFPSILLFVFMGLLPFLALAGLLVPMKARSLNRLNIYPNRYWAWTFSLYTGIAAITWITFQLLLTPYFWLQPIILFIGIGIIICVLTPSVMKSFKKN